MRSRLTLALLAIAAIACRDVTSPGTRQPVSIYGMETPAHAASTDTIRISFFTGQGGCDSGLVVSSERTASGVRFSASAVTSNTVCPLAATSLIAPLPFVFVLVPPHPAPYAVRFAQPGGTDSIRTIGP